MNNTLNTSDKSNAKSTTQPVFNYAQAAKRSSQNLDTTKTKPTAATTNYESKTTEMNGSSEHTSKSKSSTKHTNATKTDRPAFVPMPREPSKDAVSIQFGTITHTADSNKAESSETDPSVVDNTNARWDASHYSNTEPHYQTNYNNRHYGNRHNYNQNKHHSYNMQQSGYNAHHSKKSIPPHTSANSSNNQANWPGNPYYYNPNTYPISMTTSNGQNFVPQPNVNKAIPILHPVTKEVVNTSPQVISSTATKDVTAEGASKDSEIKFTIPPSRPITIVNPNDPARKIKEEADKKAKEEAEKKAKDEADKKAKEEADLKAKIEAEAKAKEATEKKVKEDAELQAKEAAEKKEKEAAEIKAKEEGDKLKEIENKEQVDEEKRIAAITIGKASRAAPGRLDISAIPPHVFQESPVSATPKAKTPTAPMRMIEDPSTIDYPPSCIVPKGRDPTTGKIHYDLDFLLQFQSLNLQSTEDLSQFQNTNEDHGDRRMQRRQTSDRGRNSRSSGDGMYRNNSRDNRSEMGKFATGGRPLSHRQGSNGPNMPSNMERQGSKNRSGRGGKGRHPPREQVGAPTIPLDQVVPLEKSENRWIPAVLTEGEEKKEPEGDMISQEVVQRKVKSLLNKLTLEKFDSISDQIYQFVKQSEREDNGLTLRNVIQLIFTKACDESQFASMWGQLCRKIYDLIVESPTPIKDVNIVEKGVVASGGILFRKYLLNRCQQDFEKGWKSDLPKFDENDPNVMMTDEYYEAVKAKRQGLGLVQFIGELYKYNMLHERIMIACLMRLSHDIETPEDEEIETMCKLLTTIGRNFDHSSRKNKEWLDACFGRMKEMLKSDTLSSRVKFMVQDLFDLRRSKWTLKRGNQPAPSTIAQIREQAKKANEEKETMKRSGSNRGGNSSRPMSRQSSHRGGAREPPRQNSTQNNYNSGTNGNNGPSSGGDGWNTVGTNVPVQVPRNRPNDLSQFGNTERSKSSRGGVLGPASSPFSSLARSSAKNDKKSVATDNRNSIASTSMSNMFSALGADGHEDESHEDKQSPISPSSSANSEVVKPEGAAPATPEVTKVKLSDELIERKSKNIIEEYFSLRDNKELCECIKELDEPEYRIIFARKLLDVVEKKSEDVEVVCKMIAEIRKEKLISQEEFTSALKIFMEGYEDLVIDVPQAPKHVDRILEAVEIEKSSL
ncbi:armadillo-type protein [Pilobolus umbonatus]|nr:armadillo-type protein [Pilobolus umbonatus]